MTAKDNDSRPLGSRNSWAKTHGSYIAGQAAIDGVDAIAVRMESKWGCGRLRLLVSTELREKFDRQRYLTNAAIWHGDLEEVRKQSERMVKAWMALDRAAEASGASKLDLRVWELSLEDGSVVALVQSYEDAKAVIAQGREVRVYDLDEIARILNHFHQVNEVKATFPGAKVEQVRRPSQDPLDAIRDGDDLDTEMNQSGWVPA
jgi:hypothetical protein